jgi:superfamily II DNA or RNA helicase
MVSGDSIWRKGQNVQPSPSLGGSNAGFRLRPYQLQAVDELQGQYRLGKGAVLLVAPTGSGKTAVGCHFVKQAVEQGKRCLWLAHRSELIRQASQRLAQDYRVRHGIIKAGLADYDPRFPVQIASVQTLARREPVEGVGLLVVDEAHHATADTYLRIIESHTNAIVLGLTATPWRLTGRQLGSLFDGIVAVANYPFLIGQGFLVRPRVFLPADLPDFSTVRLLGGDYDEDQAAAIMEHPKLVGDVLAQWRKHAFKGGKPRSTIIFACNVAHSIHIVRIFREAGIAAEHLDSQVTEKEREAILERLARGQTTVVSNVVILSEGFDCPSVSCAIVARPTASRTLFIQMLGRALRPCPEVGKSDCIILDHAANSLRHGLISEIVSYELEEGDLLDASTPTRSPCKKCPACHAVVPTSAQVCSECNHSFSLGRKLPDVVVGELVELRTAGAPAGSATPPAGKEVPPAVRPASPAVPAVEELQGPAGGTYLHLLLHLNEKDVPARLAALRPALANLPAPDKLPFVKAGLFCPQPHLWLEQMAQAKCLKPLGLGCLEKIHGIRVDGYKGLTYFDRTKRALQHAKPDLIVRLAALLFASAVPGMIDRTIRQGFRTVGGYAPHSADMASQVLAGLGLNGETRECTLELIRQHEYLFYQILHNLNGIPLPMLCKRLRKKLGPLWRQHFEFAECLWDGPVLRWIRVNFAAVCQAFDTLEEKICEIKPEEACPIDGNTLLARYGLPTGPWVRIMKHEIGQWCMSNPKEAQDLEAVNAAADAIFEQNRLTSPTYNLDLPFLQLDEAELNQVPDPLAVRQILVEASRLKVGEVTGWARGYPRKAAVGVITVISTATNSKPTASLCARYFADVAGLLRDITLGEVFKALTSPRRTPSEVVETVRKGREAVAVLRQKYERTKVKEHGIALARVLRDVGHFEEASSVANEMLRRFAGETIIARLVHNITRFLPNGESSNAAAPAGQEV